MAEPESNNLDQETVPKVISFLSCLLQRVEESNDHCLLFQSQKISVFNGLTRLNISIKSYLKRIFKYAKCIPSCFVVYLDRFVQMQPSLPINSYNVHSYYNNAHYAKVGGISAVEMNLLEVDFLFGLGFKLNVTPATFHTYCNFLQREMCVQFQSPLPQPSLKTDRPLKIHCCFNEDDHHQLAV